MKKIQKTSLIALGLVLVITMSGCMGTTGRGRLDTVRPEGGMMSIQALADSWQDYYVYYSGYYAGNATSIIFDRKDGVRTIRLPETSWTKVLDQRTLKVAINGIEANNDFSARVWNVIGPDNQSYGYLYTGWQLVNVNSISENVLTIAGIPAAYDGHHHF